MWYNCVMSECRCRISWISQYFTKSNCYKIKGRPVLSIYDVPALDQDVTAINVANCDRSLTGGL